VNQHDDIHASTHPSPPLDTSGVDLEKLKHELRRSAANPVAWEAPTVLPPAWECIERLVDGAKYRAKSRGLVAIISASFEDDGGPWLHLSVSARGRVPTWQELTWCKEVFLGDREAYQVIPPRSRYVNINPHVLHLFAQLDGASVLPDFTKATGSL
jgi:hypothetical protein